MLSLDEAAAAMRAAMRETIRRNSTWYLIQAALMVIAGVAAILAPLVASTFLVVFLGWTLVAVGAVQLMGLIGADKVPHFWLQLVSVILAMIIGFLFLRDPAAGIETLGLLLIVFLMVQGMARVVFSLTIRPLPNWGFVLASGMLGILLSLFLIANPVLSVVVLGLLIGFQLLGEGLALGYLAWHARKG
ncbi:HdeD family acid-resistance protein [Limibaculum sp. FT325]|uniref:HdeD family acid-resistance protein n=1 Tax=Thermohalobaculum sediminis TaxID=2939436 RepID=UPI0020BEADD1|nr:HdeD family acid-resistance protein [Limibaculum sediminis]MCL5779329.1 HdeD family acid-resistance protein [Limibaculum sediminis]